MPHQVITRPAISAHRGGAEVARAETWEAFSAALDSPTEYVEFDVRLTACGTWVIFHDEHAGPAGWPVRTMHHEQLCEAVGYSVPEATAVMERLAGRVLGHVDVKERTDEKAIIGPAIDIFGTAGFVAITEHAASIRRINSFAPAVRTALSTGARSRLGRLGTRRLVASGADGVALNHRLASDRVLELCKRNGMSVMVWTVNDSDLIASYLAESRIDVLITDRPRHASSVRSEMPHRGALSSPAAFGSGS